jgi:hypothetical protein
MPTQAEIDQQNLLMLADLMGRVRDMYPALGALVNQPEVQTVILQAAAAGWDNGKLQAALEGTNYWRTTTRQQRAWDVAVATDPATAQRQFFLGAKRVQDMRLKLGVEITEDDYTRIATDAVRNGWSDDVTRTALLGAHAARGYRPSPGGDFGGTVTQLRSLAKDYGVALSDETLYAHATRLLDGSMDEVGAADYMRNQAKSRYARNQQLVSALDTGLTVRQFADPYVQTAAKELSINPETIDLGQAKWARFMEESAEPGQQGMTLDQWRQIVRSDEQYGWDKTQAARDEAAQLTTQLARKFGVYA